MMYFLSNMSSRVYVSGCVVIKRNMYSQRHETFQLFMFEWFRVYCLSFIWCRMWVSVIRRKVFLSKEFTTCWNFFLTLIYKRIFLNSKLRDIQRNCHQEILRPHSYEKSPSNIILSMKNWNLNVQLWSINFIRYLKHHQVCHSSFECFLPRRTFSRSLLKTWNSLSSIKLNLLRVVLDEQVF